MPAGGWLAPEETAALLACYGITAPAAAGQGQDQETAARPPAAGVCARVTSDPLFGQLIEVGLSGAAGDAARLVPLTTTDADALVSSSASVRRLLGSGRTDAALDALRALLLRLSRLADDLPEIDDLVVDPLAACPGGVLTGTARARVLPRVWRDPFLRRLG